MALLRGSVLGEDVTAEDVMSSEPGDDVTLPCQSADPNITAVEWTRPDLGPEYIFLSVDGHFKPQNQHPSFHGRVQLDGDLMGGDASLLLKNVRSSDEGTYECRVTVDELHRRAIINEEPISKVLLQVTGSDDGDMKDGDLVGGDDTDSFIGSVAAAAAAVAVAVAAVAVFLLCLYVVKFVLTECKRRLNNEPEAPAAPPAPPAAADGAERVELCDM